MEQQEIMSKLTSIFREVFSDPNLELEGSMTAEDVEKWDSLSHMVMITTVEERFGIKFKLRDLNKLKKVEDLVTVIGSKL